MVLKLNPKEIEYLMEFDGGPFGEDTFTSFMAALCAQLNAETGELDIGRDEQKQSLLLSGTIPTGQSFSVSLGGLWTKR